MLCDILFRHIFVHKNVLWFRFVYDKYKYEFLLGRFLIIQRSRPELVPKIEKVIGDFEMSVVPRSLCAVDGSLYIPSDKASLIHAIEAAGDQPIQSNTQSQAQPPKVLNYRCNGHTPDDEENINNAKVS